MMALLFLNKKKFETRTGRFKVKHFANSLKSQKCTNHIKVLKHFCYGKLSLNFDDRSYSKCPAYNNNIYPQRFLL